MCIAVSNKLNWVGNLEYADEGSQIVKGKIVNKMVTLVGVYAPQTRKNEFFRGLIKDIEQFRERTDLNCRF